MIILSVHTKFFDKALKANLQKGVPEPKLVSMGEHSAEAVTSCLSYCYAGDYEISPERVLTASGMRSRKLP
jgi:hypothetical protein